MSAPTLQEIEEKVGLYFCYRIRSFSHEEALELTSQRPGSCRGSSPTISRALYRKYAAGYSKKDPK